MLLSNTFSKICRTTLHKVQRRNMAGGLYPSKMSINKNKYIEEWNGLREITETTFEVDGKVFRQLLLWAAILPYGVYYMARDDLERRYEATGDVRYKEMI